MTRLPPWPLLGCLAACTPAAGTLSTHTLDAVAVDETFTLTVFEPDGMAEATEVVYLFDGDDWTSTLAKVVTRRARDGATPPLIVGVGYGDRPNRRERDLTPAPHGEVEAFYAFLEGELVPWVDERYPTDPVPAARTVLGHSFGGAAAMHGLLHASGTFGNSVVISPSLTLADGVLFDQEAAYAGSHDDLVADAWLGAGALEAWGLAGMTEAMGEVLDGRGYPGLRLETELVKGRVHTDVFVPAAERGLAFVEGR